MVRSTGETERRPGERREDRAVLAREYAYRLLARFIYSEKALRQRLAARFPDSDEYIENLLDDFRRFGYLNDVKNAEFYRDQLKGRGYGPGYIRSFLKRKGFPVPGELCADDAGASMEKWYMKKTGNRKKLDRREWQRVFSYLQSKGFYSEDILEFLRGRGLYDR